MYAAFGSLLAILAIMALVYKSRSKARRDGKTEARVEQQEEFIESVNEGKRVQDRIVFDDVERQRVRDKYDQS